MWGKRQKGNGRVLETRDERTAWMKRYILTGTPGSGKTSIQRRVFFIEHLGFCQPTEARKITFEESLLFEKIHEETYTSLGYDLRKIAPEALSERVHRIMEWTWRDL